MVITTQADSIRSVLELDLELKWTLEEVYQLKIDLNEVFDGLDLDEDIATFAKGLVGFEGEGLTEAKGSLSLKLGIGLEYQKSTKTILPFIKGTTGLKVAFRIKAAADFAASVGPFTADINVLATVDDYGEDLSIQFGLEDSLNYYLSSNKTLARTGFVVVASPQQLVDRLDVSVSGRVVGEVDATLKIPPTIGEGSASVKFVIPDINNFIQKKPNAFVVVYRATLRLNARAPSLIDLLLMDPEGIVKVSLRVCLPSSLKSCLGCALSCCLLLHQAVDNLFKEAEVCLFGYLLCSAVGCNLILRILTQTCALRDQSAICP